MFLGRFVPLLLDLFKEIKLRVFIIGKVSFNQIFQLINGKLCLNLPKMSKSSLVINKVFIKSI